MHYFSQNKVLLQDISTRTTFRNAFSGHSDSWYLVSQTCYHCKKPLYCIVGSTCDVFICNTANGRNHYDVRWPVPVNFSSIPRYFHVISTHFPYHAFPISTKFPRYFQTISILFLTSIPFPYYFHTICNFHSISILYFHRISILLILIETCQI